MPQTILATDLDGTFLGGTAQERASLYDWINARRDEIVLIYVTGRSLTTMRDVLEELPLQPDHIISDVGTAVYVGAKREPLAVLESWLDAGWQVDKLPAVREMLGRHPHLTEQPVVEGRRMSYFYSDLMLAQTVQAELEAQGYDVLLSAEQYFDVLPRGVQKGPTLLRALDALGLPHERTLVAGDTLNDLSLFQTGLQGVIVANREPLLAEAAKDLPNVHWSTKNGAAGVLDALHRIH